MSTSSKTLIADKNATIDAAMIRGNRIPDTYLAQYVPSKAEATLDSVTQHQAFLDQKPAICNPTDIKGNAVVSVGSLDKNEIVDVPFIRYKYSKILLNNHPISSWSSKRGTIEFKSKNHIKHSKVQIQYGSKRLFAGIIACEILGVLGIIAGIIIQKRTPSDMI